MGFNEKKEVVEICFYDSAGAEVGLSGIVVRELAAEFLRSNPAENENFVCEPFEKLCSDVATNGRNEIRYGSV